MPDELSYFSLLDADDPLRKAIQQWGETYHLNSAWCYDVALRTLQNWHDFKETAGKWFAFVPSFAHANFIGFASLVDIYKLISLPPDSLTELQKEFLASSRFSEQDRQFVESFTEQERAFLSMYTHDPHIMSDEHFLNQMEELIKAGIPSVNTYLPVRWS